MSPCAGFLRASPFALHPVFSFPPGLGLCSEAVASGGWLAAASFPRLASEAGAFYRVRVPDCGASLMGSYICRVTCSLGYQKEGNADLKREVRVRAPSIVRTSTGAGMGVPRIRLFSSRRANETSCSV